jgi:hypothetical protein
MLHHVPTSQPQTDANLVRIGVGIDTSRYGHYAAFLRQDLQPAVGELQFVESADGYAQLRSRLEQIVAKLGAVHFAVRIDVANQYADNLLNFLHALQARLANATFTISCGDPKRNKDYRPPSSAPRSPIPSRPALPHAMRSASNPLPSRCCPPNCELSVRSPVACKQSCANARVSSINSTCS